MTHKIAVMFALGCLLVLCVAPFAPGQIALLAPVLPSPADVVRIIDTLTKKDSDTSVDVKMGKTTGQGKLLVAHTRVNVALERSSRNWRGRVVVQMSVPTEISYSIDLTSIKPEHIRLDAFGRLIVTMPTPQVEAVTPNLSSVKIDNGYKGARFRRADTNVSFEMQSVMLREDYQAKARTTAKEQLPRIREEGKGTLEAFLQKMLATSFPGLKVVVQ